MGCCVSSNKSAKPSKSGHISDSKTAAAARHGGVSKSPPPSHSLHEEETVKEVLSETPKPPSPRIPKFQSKHESPFIKSAPLLQEKRQNGVVHKPPYLTFAAAASDDLSEASEIGSTLSESVSAATSVAEKRDNNGDRRSDSRELRQRSPARLRNRPFSGEMQREKAVGRSPGRRSDPSPGWVRPGSGSGYGKRRENGESSGRRSRSPVTRAESGLGRAPSARKAGKSPGRVGPGSGEKIRKLESGDSKWPAPAPTNASNDEELMENPLVSLECFIFL